MERERKPIGFLKWKPVKRDLYIGYSYIVEAGPRGARKITPGVDRWMRARYRIASSALATGTEEFRVWGGMGVHSWTRTVIVAQKDAEWYLRTAAERDFTMKGTLAKALAARERRLKREITEAIQAWSDENIVGQVAMPDLVHRYAAAANSRISAALVGTGYLGQVVNPHVVEDDSGAVSIEVDGIRIWRADG